MSKKEVIEILDDSDVETGAKATVPVAAAANDQDDKKTAAYSFKRPRKGGECTICYCDYSRQEGVVLTNCGHKFCQDCVVQYIQTKAQDGEVLRSEMVCPHLDDTNKKCGSPSAQADILACLGTQKERDRYLRLSLSRTVTRKTIWDAVKVADSEEPTISDVGLTTRSKISQSNDLNPWSTDERLRNSCFGDMHDLNATYRISILISRPQCTTIIRNWG